MVKKIPLTQGQYALVDDEDHPWLNSFKWYALFDEDIKDYYAVRNSKTKKNNGECKRTIILMHRLIMDPLKGMSIDHINNNSLDNRKTNLRIVTNRQNQQNQKRKTSSKYPGVYWNKRCKKWMARIKINRKNKYLGLFVNEREAAKAYERACRELVGEELVCKTHVAR